MLPVDEKIPVFGSYSSALAQVGLGGLNPPATSTLPFGSSVAVWTVRALLALPVGAKLPGCAAAGRGRLSVRSKTALAVKIVFIYLFLHPGRRRMRAETIIRRG